ncbi:MAG: DUF898 domain-containing protein [Proteobacteria bacterium]|nr:MAG: DUF898 domain-containing protein [Pseudomonadota bacterium]QKK11640.1 MAG: DUF898 domain-containing protein [Pseudomonadota bacterium]
MSGTEYAIVCNGDLVEGFELADVKARLVTLFKQPVEQIEKIFARPGTVIKSGLNEGKAEHFRSTLAKAGLVVHIKPLALATPRPDGQVPTAAAAQAPASATDDSSSWGLVPVGREGAAQGSPEAQQSAAGDAAPPRAETPATATSDTYAEPRTVRFVFHGQGREYFSIWIVNILLTIVTLGIYSAWAKVRNKQYFYGSTELDGAPFEYTGKPKAILKGRLIAGALFIVYSVVSQLFPALGLLLFLLLLAVMPWMITRSLMFNARNSIYRNVRLRFDGSLKHAYIAFAMLPLATVVTFGILAPFAFYYQQRFFVENHSYGTARFHFEAGAKDYIKMFVVLVLVFLGGVFGGAMISGFLPFIGLPMILAAYLFVFIYFSVQAFNLRFNNTLLSHSGFAADMELGGYTKLVVVNTLATVFTLGLFRPWAMVRTVRYKCEHLHLLAEENLDGFVAQEEAELSALGEEMGEMFDFEFGL